MSPAVKSFLRLSFGNIIEWYDFSLYIFFAVYIAKDFFPDHEPYISMVMALATFFLGSLVRPIGGLLIGWLSDRYHQKAMINLCVIAMGFSTFLVSILPDYNMIGIWSPVLLILLRIIQGLSVGGQFPSLITLTVNDHEKNKGFLTGLVFAISSFGFLLASLVGFVMTTCFSYNSQLIWRIPFALSGVLFLAYLFINRNENHGSSTKVERKSNVFAWLVSQYKAFIGVILLTTMSASIYYVVFTYLVSYQITELRASSQKAFFINSFTLAIVCVFYPILGRHADRIGLRRLFYMAVISLFILSIPIMLIIQTKAFVFVLLAIILLAFLIAAIQGAISPLFATVFDDEWQTTGCALAYSIGNGISGLAPLVAFSLVTFFPVYGLGFLIMGLLVLGMVGMFIINSL